MFTDCPPRLHPARVRLATRSARSRARKIWNVFFSFPSQRGDVVLSGGLRSAVPAEASDLHVDELTLQFVDTMVRTLDARDPYTAGHSHRVSATSTAIAECMGLSPKQIEVIRIGALLHDIGKIGVPDAVLLKPAKLSRDEYTAIQQHTVIGKRILEKFGHFQKFLPFTELHHENYAGNGYPYGLKGDEIPLPVRIVHLADVYDALGSDRAYRAAMAEHEIVETMIRGSGKLFDPAVVDVFLEVIRERPVVDGTFRIADAPAIA